MQEERLTRHKNQGGFPTNAFKEVLSVSNLTIGDIDQVAFSGYGKSKIETREHVLANYLRKIEPPKPNFAKKLPSHSAILLLQNQKNVKD